MSIINDRELPRMKCRIKCLYLRTQYTFDQKAGGSVGHTKGVIDALEKVVDLSISSNDKLYGVNKEVKIIKPIMLPFFPSSLNELIYNARVFFNLIDGDFDIIYHRYSPCSFSAAAISLLKKKKLVLEFNSSEVWKLKNWRDDKKIYQHLIKLVKLKLVRRIENFNLRNAHKVVVVSKALEEQLVSNGLDKNKITVMPNGIDPQLYCPQTPNEALINKFGLKGKKVVGFIGTFGKWHGVDVLVEAYAHLLRDDTHLLNNTRLLLVGDGELMPHIKKLVSDFGLEDNIILTGLVEQCYGRDYLALCDILVNSTVKNPDSSEFFGSPTKLFEYMGMGKAIVSSNMAQMGDILNDGKTALLVEPGSISQLSAAIGNLIHSEQEALQMGRLAREYVVEHHTWDRNIEKLMGEYLCHLQEY